MVLENTEGEEIVFFEEFIKGQEFSCIVIKGEQGKSIALPPTQIVKKGNFFDYRSKYLPGMTRKVTPIEVRNEWIEHIRQQCADLFEKLGFDVYARIDGFITEKGEVFLNDPNTTSGMLPSSFFFHQAAEIGLNPSQFLTYIIRTSVKDRLRTGKHLLENKQLLKELDGAIADLHSEQRSRTRVAVIMGGYSAERHISVESGRNIYEKLSASLEYEPVPVFLTGAAGAHELYLMPVNVMLKDNADDIADKVRNKAKDHPVLVQIREEAEHITKKYAGNSLSKPRKISYGELADLADMAFIALHGRPGEDGEIQQYLQKIGLPYNGSGVESSGKTINKYETNELLAQNGILVAKHRLFKQADYAKQGLAYVEEVEGQFAYPFIAKPCDDGCSAAVKKIKSREEFLAFIHLIFRTQVPLMEAESGILHLQVNEEFPRKKEFLIEELIGRNGAEHFLEITSGLYTTYDAIGKLKYHVFEPSEALATGDVLSLEEKFLAGQGQNITPSRFAKDAAEQDRISQAVKAVLEKTARLMGVEGYCRTDAFVRIYADGKVEVIVIEINSLPGMTPATCIFHQAALDAMKPLDFISAILQFGKQRSLRVL